jgi:hypothetical protein
MIFAAVDPGSVNAAVAVFSDGTPLFVDDIRTAYGMIDCPTFARALRQMKVERIVVENVHAMPKQGISSTFRFGMGCGIIHGIAGALQLPLTLVAPTQWKAYHHLNADKEKARALAIQRWPEHSHRLERKKDVNRAEAMLIGDWYYARRYVKPDPEYPFE